MILGVRHLEEGPHSQGTVGDCDVVIAPQQFSVEDRRNKSAVRESSRISELKCLELFEELFLD